MPHLLLHTLCHPSLPPPRLLLLLLHAAPHVSGTRVTLLLSSVFFSFTLHPRPCTLPILLHHSHYLSLSPLLCPPSSFLPVFKAHTLLPGPGCAEWTERAEQWPPLSFATQRGGAQFLFIFLFIFLSCEFRKANAARLLLAHHCHNTSPSEVKAALFNCLFVYVRVSGKLSRCGGNFSKRCSY